MVLVSPRQSLIDFHYYCFSRPYGFIVARREISGMHEIESAIIEIYCVGSVIMIFVIREKNEKIDFVDRLTRYVPELKFQVAQPVGGIGSL
jgi:RecB family endonuclease NucS